MAREAKFYQDGDRIDYTNSSGSDISAGDVINLGSRIGIALTDIADGETGAVKVEGIFKIAAITGTAFSIGNKLYWDPTNSQLEVNAGLSAGDASAADGNTGDGTVGSISAGDNAIAETWTLECISTATDGGTFSVIGSKTGRMDDAEVGSAYDNGKIAFTISDGDTDFAEGDTFTIDITEENVEAGWAPYAKESATDEAYVKIG